MTPKLISVVIPVYNHVHTLRACLVSVVRQAQDLSDCGIEIIVVNDGSTDNFASEISRLLSDDFFKEKITAVVNQENRGAPAARNAGARLAKGDYLIFVDADTICYPKMFQEMASVLSENFEASYCYSRFRFGLKLMKSQKFDAQALKKNNYIDTTSLIRAKDFVGFDESIKRFQDWDMWLTMLEQKKTGVFIKKVLFKKSVAGRVGISSWVPSFFYKLPWKTKTVKNYEAAKEVIIKKHGLR